MRAHRARQWSRVGARGRLHRGGSGHAFTLAKRVRMFALQEARLDTESARDFLGQYMTLP